MVSPPNSHRSSPWIAEALQLRLNSLPSFRTIAWGRTLHPTNKTGGELLHLAHCTGQRWAGGSHISAEIATISAPAGLTYNARLVQASAEEDNCYKRPFLHTSTPLPLQCQPCVGRATEVHNRSWPARGCQVTGSSPCGGVAVKDRSLYAPCIPVTSQLPSWPTGSYLLVDREGERSRCLREKTERTIDSSARFNEANSSLVLPCRHLVMASRKLPHRWECLSVQVLFSQFCIL